MKSKRIVALFITLILVACSSIPGQAPSQSIELTSTLAEPSLTFTPNPTSTETPTPVITLTASPTFTATLPVLLTPNPALLKDFVGTYRFVDANDSPCTLEIKSDGTFAINYTFMKGMWNANLEGNLLFADGRFFLNSPNRNADLSPFYCFPQALIPVYWGDRRYLFDITFIDNEEFSAEFISQFCEDIRTGKEPRNSISIADNFYFLRETDATVKVTGVPVRQDGQLLCQ